MSSLSNNCKIDSNCQIVIPIDERANIGHTLSAINLNFDNLDISLCNITASADTLWTPASEEFFESLPKWNEMLTVIETYSSCWNETFNTVNTLSAFWLKPISLIYPYPFADGAVNTNVLVQDWLNENFPPRVGGCFNFIVGQELYVFTPEYSNINRSLISTQTVALSPTVRVVNSGGVKLRQTRIVQNGNATFATFTGNYRCIQRSTPFTVRIKFEIDSSTSVLTPDQFIEKIVGMKFEIDPETYTWKFVQNLFNIT
jgi:hypothetical protein